MIRTFVFDLGNVLLFFSHDRMCAQMGALCGLPGAKIKELVCGADGLAWAFERGEVSQQEFHARFQELVGVEVPDRKLLRACADIFRPNDSIFPIVEQLKLRGSRLVLLSNTNEAHFEFLERRYDVLKCFDELVLSCRVGAMKPDNAIFEALLSVIHCDPEDCFYTDDIAEYVQKARGFGLQAEVFIDTTTLLTHLQQRNVTFDRSR